MEFLTQEQVETQGMLEIYTVDAISSHVKTVVEGRFGSVRVQGEISGYRGPHTSGHCYFSLKGAKARLDAIIWRTTFRNLKVPPTEGSEVIASGRLTTYPGKSGYQIVIDSLEIAGFGAWMAVFEERKRSLAAEGLFAPERKQPIPPFPRKIGVITSPTGAVIRDIIHRLEERWPCHVILWPVSVQGAACAQEVATALQGFNSLALDHAARPDTIIVARGGGSCEELWGFNEEVVVRAVSESAIPVLSAVGHETDWTLIDLVADQRAPTPTAAAEMAVPVRGELIKHLQAIAHRGQVALSRGMENRHKNVHFAIRHRPRLGALLDSPRQSLDMLQVRFMNALKGCIHRRRLRFAQFEESAPLSSLSHRISHGCARNVDLHLRAKRSVRYILERNTQTLSAALKLVQSLNYRKVLERGYAIVSDSGGRMLRSVAQIVPGEILKIELGEGTFTAAVVESFPGEGKGDSRAGKAKRKAALSEESSADPSDQDPLPQQDVLF